MKMQHVDKIECPLCNGTSFKAIHLYHEFSGKKFEKLICRHCTLIQLHPMLTEDEIKRLYSFDYFQKAYRCEAPQPYWKMIDEIGNDFKRRVMPLIQHYIGSEGYKALEIGCAGGAVLKVLEEAGFHAYGVEINPQIAEWGKEHLGVNIMKGTLEDQKFPSGFFDVVYLGDLLEHITKPVEFLREVWRVTSVGAILIIDIPFEMNAVLPRLFYSMLAPLLHMISGYERQSPYPPYHAFVYSPKTIKRLLRKNGFEVISLRQSKILRLSSWKAVFDVPNLFLTKVLNALGDRATVVAKRINEGVEITCLSELRHR